jgi:hypothetical protein
VIGNSHMTDLKWQTVGLHLESVGTERHSKISIKIFCGG